MPDLQKYEAYEAHEKSDTFQFQPRGSSDFWFACVDIDVIRDKALSTCDKAVFAVICTHVNVQTRDCPLRVKTIAEEANCSVRSVQESLKALVARGVIERIECFENGKQKASVYKIVGHRASCYRGADSAPTAKNTVRMGADFAPTSESFTGRGAENDVLSLQEPNIYEKDTSPSERGINPREESERYDNRYEKNDDQIFPEDLFDDVPPAMRETLDYFLLKTGRDGICPEELSALRALEEIHTPGRVNKEISQAAERFKKKDKPLESLTLVYIYKSLQYQNSFKNSKGNTSSKGEISEEDPYKGCYL